MGTPSSALMHSEHIPSRSSERFVTSPCSYIVVRPDSNLGNAYRSCQIGLLVPSESEGGMGDRQCFGSLSPRLYWLGGWECIVVLYRHKCRWPPCSVVLRPRTGVDHERCRGLT